MHRDNQHLFAVPYPVMPGTPQLKRITMPNLRQSRVLNAPPKGPGNVNILASPVEIVARIPGPTDVGLTTVQSQQPQPQQGSTTKLATAAEIEYTERQSAIHGFANQEIQSVTATLANFKSAAQHANARNQHQNFSIYTNMNDPMDVMILNHSENQFIGLASAIGQKTKLSFLAPPPATAHFSAPPTVTPPPPVEFHSPSTTDTTDTTSEKLYTCPWPGCTKQFTQLYNIKPHYFLHSKMRPYKCGDCEADFARLSDLLRHTRTVHKGLKDFECGKCGDGFSRRDSLQRHLKSCNR
ncbi:hypothetical protein BJ741DRAFT_595816 [Chytriomyces cf. hyalinus JEL632]|nr:hypothetical protein BJ741DRAFT_595816 [Chytriomyces cf. hyalinus JEL632]